jgi:predicted metal-dependent hydrolase
MSPARLVPDQPLPPYAFVPGRSPHPVSDPAGHSYGLAHRPEPFDPRRWQTQRGYLFGLDLFNHGYYWEAHEAWEALWHACGRRGAVADLLKGLIRLAAAGVKVREGRPAGVASHAAAAARLFADVARALGADARPLGLDLGELADHARQVAALAASLPPGGVAAPGPVFAFALLPTP